MGHMSFSSAVAGVLLWPGDATCSALGLRGNDKGDLVRMLVNSLVWTVLGVIVVAVVS
jgi:hypothetical protein